MKMHILSLLLIVSSAKTFCADQQTSKDCGAKSEQKAQCNGLDCMNPEHWKHTAPSVYYAEEHCSLQIVKQKTQGLIDRYFNEIQKNQKNRP